MTLGPSKGFRKIFANSVIFLKIYPKIILGTFTVYHQSAALAKLLKYSNINCTEWWIPAKKMPDVSCEVPDLRSGGIPLPQFNPWSKYWTTGPTTT